MSGGDGRRTAPDHTSELQHGVDETWQMLEDVAQRLSEQKLYDKLNRLLVDHIPKYLRRLVILAWHKRYRRQYTPGQNFGIELLFGTEPSFERCVGQAYHTHDGQRMFRVFGCNLSKKLRACRKLRIGEHEMWLANSSPLHISNGCCSFKTKEELPQRFTTVEHLNVFGLSSPTFDRHLKDTALFGSSGSLRVLNKLLDGRLDQFDATPLFWLLLNSAHDAEKRGRGLGLLSGLSDDPSMGRLCGSLRRIRDHRNNYQSHISGSHVSAEKFTAVARDVLDMARHLDSVASRVFNSAPSVLLEFTKWMQEFVQTTSQESPTMTRQYFASRPVRAPPPRAHDHIVPRSDVVNDIELEFFPPHTATHSNPKNGVCTCVLTGSAGMGKTEIARDYFDKHVRMNAAERSHSQTLPYPGALLWLSAQSREMLAKDLQDVAVNHLASGLDEKQQWEKDIRSQPSNPLDRAWWHVHKWLSETNGRWLLVIDSADDPEVLAPIFEQLLQIQSPGRILMTSQPQTWNRWSATFRAIHVAKMNLENAGRLLLQIARPGVDFGNLTSEESHSIHKICGPTMVDGLPLGVRLAGDYIRRERCSFEEYCHRFEASPTETLPFGGMSPSANSSKPHAFFCEIAGSAATKAICEYMQRQNICLKDLAQMHCLDLNDKLEAAGITDRDIRKRIVTAIPSCMLDGKGMERTWAISYEQLQKQESEAAIKMLHCLCFLAPDNIPTGKFLRDMMSNVNGLPSATAQELSKIVSDAIQCLKQLSFLCVSGSAATGSPEFLSMHPLVQVLGRGTVRNRAAVFNVLCPLLKQWLDDKSLCSEVLPHAINAIRVFSSSDFSPNVEELLGFGTFCHDVGQACVRQFMFTASRTAHNAGLKVWEELLEVNEFDDVDILRRRAMGTSFLGEVGRKQGTKTSLSEALRNHKKSLELYREHSKRTGEEKFVAVQEDMVGLAYFELREYVEAAKHHQVSLDMKKKINLNATVHITLGNLGRALQLMGKFGSAKDVFAESLQYRLSVSSSNRWARAEAAEMMLGGLATMRGRPLEAIKHLTSAVTTFESKPVSEYRDRELPRAYMLRGAAKTQIGKYNAAKEDVEQALGAQRKLYGGYSAVHRTVAISLIECGTVHLRLQDAEKARQFFVDAVVMLDCLFEDDVVNEDRMRARSFIGACDIEQGKHGVGLERLRLQKDALDHLKDSSSIGQRVNAQIYRHLSRAHFVGGNFDQAIKHAVQASTICEQLYGNSYHTLEALALEWTARVERARRQRSDVGTFQGLKDRVLQMAQSVLGQSAQDHPMLRALYEQLEASPAFKRARRGVRAE